MNMPVQFWIHATVVISMSPCKSRGRFSPSALTHVRAPILVLMCFSVSSSVLGIGLLTHYCGVWCPWMLPPGTTFTFALPGLDPGWRLFDHLVTCGLAIRVLFWFSVGYWALYILVRSLICWHGAYFSLRDASCRLHTLDVVGNIPGSTALRLLHHLTSAPFSPSKGGSGASGYRALVGCYLFSWVSWRRKSWFGVETAPIVDSHTGDRWATLDPLVPWVPLGLRVLFGEILFLFSDLLGAISALPGASVGGVRVHLTSQGAKTSIANLYGLSFRTSPIH